jgi:hypothetical protein
VLELPPGAVLLSREESELGVYNDGGMVKISLASPRSLDELFVYCLGRYEAYSLGSRAERFRRRGLPSVEGAQLLGQERPGEGAGVAINIAPEPFSEFGMGDAAPPMVGMRSYA